MAAAVVALRSAKGEKAQKGELNTEDLQIRMMKMANLT